MVRIRVNGEERRLEAATVADMLSALGVPAERPGIAVAINGTLVPRATWQAAPIADADAVEVVTARMGG